MDIKSLIVQIRESKINYDHLIIVTRGGLVPGGFISQYLRIKSIFCVAGSFNAQNIFEIRLPAPRNLEGNIIFVSDLVKTGNTIKNLLDQIYDFNPKIALIDIACIQYFSSISSINPKYFVRQYEEDIFIKYPWEE